MARRSLDARQWLTLAWGVGGVIALLARAMWRLGAIAVEGLGGGLTAGQLALLVVWSVAILYAEGYRAFQRRFAPRVVARALHLLDRPRLLHVALAPMYCMSLLHARRRSLIAGWALLVGIAALIVVVRQLPQ